MLWLALHAPLLSLEAFVATLPAADAARPVALVGDHRITAANAAATGRGIGPGIKRATAMALAADLLLAQADALRDAAALQAVAHAAMAITPMVALHDKATVLLEVQPSLRYFGGLPRVLQHLRRCLAPLQHTVNVASAPTPLGAALLAAWGDGHAEGPHSTDPAALQRLLDGAPVWLLGPGREHWEALQGMGLQTVSDLRRLPRTGLARRFGEGLLDDLDAALGKRPDPRQPLLPPPAFDSGLELFARADTTAQVLHGAAILLARLVAWAQARQARVAAFTLQMQHGPRHRGTAAAAAAAAAAVAVAVATATATATDLRIELAEPSLDAGHLQLLLRERLARVALLAPTLELRLHCSDVVHRAAPNGELFPNRQSQEQGMALLLDRLRARLGEEQVLRIVPVADHRPERACGLQPVSAPVGAPLPMPPPVAGLPLQRPVWLLPEPVPLASRKGLPLWAGRALHIVSGPERIEAGWWDGGLVTRDYFIAQNADGALLWIFCDRLTAGADGWFLQGRFG